MLLASTLLAGCNDSTATSPADAAANGPAAQSLSGNIAPDRTLSPTSTASSTDTSTPASTPKSTPATTNKSVDVTWSAPTANTNGSALTNLAGYTIYYGTNPSSLSKSVKVANAGATDYVVQGLSDGTWYFAVTAYTNTGLQSSYSTIVSKTIT